jgi:hypothetical protein
MNQHDADALPGATVHYLRGLAANRVERTSLRRVAAEIGMSPTGLKKFLQGTDPYSPTVRRLRSWFVEHADQDENPLRVEEADAALSVLVHDLPPDPRRHTAGGVLDCLGTGYDMAGRGRPAWVAELRARYGPDRPAAP